MLFTHLQDEYLLTIRICSSCLVLEKVFISQPVVRWINRFLVLIYYTISTNVLYLVTKKHRKQLQRASSCWNAY